MSERRPNRVSDEEGRSDETLAESNSTETEPETDDGLSRRDLLVSSGLLAGTGVGAYLFLNDSDEDVIEDGVDTTPTPEESGPSPFEIWADIEAGLRESPDHLPGTAETVVDGADAEDITDFVTSDIATQPPDIESHQTDAFVGWVNGGPSGTLRSGMGTPREKAELLATLLSRSGYESEVVRYQRPLSESQLRDAYFSPVDHEFDPGFSDAQLAGWRTELGLDESADREGTVIDPGGEASTDLAARITEGLPDEAGQGGLVDFNWDGPDAVPIVRFRPESDSTDTETGTSTSTDTDAVESSREDWQYVDLFHEDESFGTLREQGAVEQGTEPISPSITVALEAATTDAPEERFELVSGRWNGNSLAGRQLFIQTLPAVSPFDYPSIRHTDVNRFVPSLTVQDPSTDQSELDSLSVTDEAFSVTGDRYTVDDTGTVRRNQTIIQENESRTDIVVEKPDGTQVSVEPLTGDKTVQDFYSPGAQSDLAEALERNNTTVTFFYRNTSTGRLSLVFVNDKPGSGGGGNAKLTFRGVRGYEWFVKEGGNDWFQTPEGTFGPSESVIFGWNPGFNDGGAFGHFSLPFEFNMIHEGKWNDGERSGLDRWVIVDGNDLSNAIEVATFSEEPEDVSVKFSYREGTGADAPDESTPSDSLSAVQDVSVSANGESYPQVELEVEAVDGDSQPVGGLPGTAFEFMESEERVVAELVDIEESYTFSYRSPADAEPETEQSVTVTVPEADVEATTSYDVPDMSTDPRAEQGLCGLYLLVRVGDEESIRTVAGWDPVLDRDREPSDADRNEVLSTLFGNHVLAFESAGVTPTVFLTDELAGKQSLEPLVEAGNAGTQEDVRNAVRGGVTAIEQYPQHFHPPLPARVTEDAITYDTGLRTVLFGRKPQFGSSTVQLSIDILSTSTVRTLRRDDNREQEFQRTLEATARRAIVERENLDRSTASLLSDATLAPASQTLDGWSDSVRTQFETARERRPTSNDYQVVDADGETAAFWNVDAQTGELIGVMPDGSGGGDSVAEIKEQLKKIQTLIDRMGLLVDAAGGAAGGAAMGVVVDYYKLLAKLYAIASIAIATMDANQLQQQAQEAVAKFACNLVVDMGLDWAGDAIESVVSTASDVSGAMGGPTVGC